MSFEKLRKHIMGLFIRLEFLSYASLIRFVNKMHIAISFIIASITALFITVINYTGVVRLPLFPAFMVLFLVAVLVSYYSLYNNEKKQKEFYIEIQGDQTISVIRQGYLRHKERNRNYLFHILSFFVIPLRDTIQIRGFVINICFIALFIILNISIMGYVQYMHYIFFVKRLAKTKENIELYDKDSPNNTEWLLMISKHLQHYNLMFFVVGCCYLYLFYIFSFSGHFPLDQDKEYIIALAWVILVVLIVFVYPFITLYANSKTKSIARKLKEQRLKILQANREHSHDKDNEFRVTTLIVLLKQNSDFTIKNKVYAWVSLVLQVVNTSVAIVTFFTGLVPVSQAVIANIIYGF